MFCRTCKYPLWNIRDRRCPECGTEFRPSDFRFVPGAVRFCCPKCAQAYYGTSAEGHLQPREFVCVKCATAVSMDDMVVLPAEGMDEEATSAEHMPWLDNRRGFFSRWFSTIGWSMTAPTKLIAGTPVNSSLGRAVWFALLTMSLYVGALFIPFCGFGAFAALAGPRGGAGGVAILGGMAMGLVVWLLLALALTVAWLMLWALISHGLLRIGGPLEAGLGRTMQCFMYATGAYVLMAIPCIGGYLGMVTWVWMAVSAILMLKKAHRVSGGRASFAVLTPPITLMLGGLILFAMVIMPGITRAITSAQSAIAQAQAAATTVASEQATAQTILDSLRKHADNPPRHAARLVASRELAPTQFVLSQTGGPGPESILVGRTTLQELSGMADSAQERELARAEAEMPKDLIAHRVGDVVFTYHGVDMKNGDGDLWLFVAEVHTAAPAGPIITPDPSMPNPRIRTRRPRPTNPQVPSLTSVWLVGTNDGQVTIIPDLIAATADQNRLRSAQGFPPLPMASDVKTYWPVSGRDATPNAAPTAPDQPAPDEPPSPN